MKLAAGAGITVAPVELTEVGGRDVLLVQRFDRVATPQGWSRRAMVSGLTLLGLAEHEATYASYEDLAQKFRRDGTDPAATLREIFARMCFNILVGNTDDHARNHAAFWDGAQVSLTPVYDIDPRPRRSHEANQAMMVRGTARQSRLALALEAAPSFHLRRIEAEEIVARQVEAILDLYPAVAKDAGFEDMDHRVVRGQALLRPYAFEGLQGRLAGMEPSDTS